MDERIPRYPKKRNQSWKQNYRNLSYWYDLISGTFNIHHVFSQLFTTCVVPKSCTEHCNFLVCNVQCKPKSEFDETCKIQYTRHQIHFYLHICTCFWALQYLAWCIAAELSQIFSKHYTMRLQYYGWCDICLFYRRSLNQLDISQSTEYSGMRL